MQELQKVQNFYPCQSSVFASVATGTALGIANFRFDEASLRYQNNPPTQSYAKQIEKFVKNNQTKALNLAKWRFCVLQPVVEETIFRGYIYNIQKEETDTFFHTKAEYFSNRAKNISFNAALFALSHFDVKAGVKNSVKMMPNMFLSGVLFAGLAEITGDLWAPLAAHIGCNAANMHSMIRKK